MQVNAQDLMIRLLWALFVIAVYAGLWYAVAWSMTNHPQWVVLIIAVGGIPVVLVALKFYGREQQRLTAWSCVNDYAKGDLSNVPQAHPDQILVGICFLEDVPFRAVSISVNENGIRLDRPFRPIRPLVILWECVQRLDTNETGGEVTLRNQNSTHGARIYLKNMDRPILLYPWNSEFQERLPRNIGHDHLQAPL